MAMSRSFGGSVVDQPPPMRISPPVTSSSPAIMRSSVDLPQPGRADQHDELAVLDGEVDAVQHRVTAPKALRTSCDLDRGHAV